MPVYGGGERIEIGEVLKDARTRQGLDIRTVEERTKIRTKYLRALEASDWDVLPSGAYAKGFLRTYAQLLGLDADALVDEYRRQVEVEGAPAYPVGERVLEHRRRLGDGPRGPGLGAVIGAVLVLVVGVLLVLGLTGDEDDGGGERAEKRQARAERLAEKRRQERRRERRQQAAEQEPQPATLRLVMNSDVSVCLLGDGERPLIDGQVLLAGNEESFEAERFELRFPFGYDRGQFDLTLDGERIRLPERQGPQAFAITPPDRVQPQDTPDQSCP